MLLVNTLGRFQITDGKNSLDESKMNSQMLIKLFTYLILHRDKSLLTEDIVNAVWTKEKTDNPTGALKNLMYRLRKLLNDSFGQQDYILSSRGTYAWNSEIDVVVDAEEFEKIIGRAKEQTNISPLREEYEEALTIYEGDFLNTIIDVDWIKNLNAYYHSMYLSTVKSLEKLCSEQKNYEKVDNIAEIQFDIIEENPEGVFFCSYLVFREIYQLEARKSLRSGLPNQLVLFTLETATQETEDVCNYHIKRGMERMENVMRRALRIGDVAAKYSDSQYLLLLTNCTNESGFMVANRIVNRITEGNTKYNEIKIRIDIEEVNCEMDI